MQCCSTENVNTHLPFAIVVRLNDPTQLVATNELSGHWQQQRDKIIGRYEYILSVELAKIVEVLALSYICSYTSTLTVHYSSLRHLYGRLTARYKAPKISECINVQRWTEQENTPTWPNVLLSKYDTLVNNEHWLMSTNRCTLANNRGPIMAYERNASNQVYSVLHYVIDMWVKCGKPLQKDGPFTSPPTR